MTGARLSHLFVHVRSLAEARHFYVDLLGLQPLVEEGDYLRVGNADGWHMGMEEAEPIGSDGIELVIRVPNVDEAFQQLTEAGVRLEGPPEDMEWGARHVWLRDPSGYRLSLFS
jgi:catechol 2,3-dioxygenase-like lactoylglutathione lyase family enzyme